MIAVRVTGLAGMEHVLEAIPAELQETHLLGAMATAAEPVAAAARALAPRADEPTHPKVGPGADSIRVWKLPPEPTRPPTVAVTYDQRHYYMGWQELGSSRHAAQPFLRPAQEADGGAFVHRTGEAMYARVAKLIRRVASHGGA